MNLFKRFVAFAIAAVMICGMLPVPAAAVETHDHSEHSDIQPFTGTADLIAQVQAMLVKEGKTGAEEVADQELISTVERESGYSYSQAATLLSLGFFNNRTGNEGQISTAHLNLDEDTMSALVERTLKDYYLDGIIEVEYVVENGVVSAVNFTMRDSFAAGLDEIKTDITTQSEQPEVTVELETEPETEEEEHHTAVASYSVEVASEKAFPFTDVPNWAKTAVNYLYQRGIVSGVSSTKYGSTMNVTRGQAVMMIWRAVNSPEPEGKNTFTDVKDSAYYADAVVWAAENGIVSGTGNNKFSPSANITREQLIAIMYKLAQFMGLDISNKASLSSFKDAGSIAKYAQEAVKWGVAAGLVSGYEDSTFRPKSTATRAEYAQILYKYLLIEPAEDEPDPTDPTDPTEPTPTEPTPTEPTPTEPTPTEPKPTEPEHVHNLTSEKAVDATCTEAGNIAYYYCADCGKYYADANASKELNKEDTVIAATGHDLTAHAAVEATCTTAGNTAYWECANCGKYFSDEAATKAIEKDSWIVEALGHDYKAVVTDPTCTEGGYTTYTCANCGDSYVSDRTSALGHNYDAVVTAPTCTEAGYTTYTCTVCGDSYVSDRTDALGHNYKSVVTAPTCTEEGYTTYTCDNCGDTYVDDKVAALGHDYKAVVTDPTCTDKGYTTYTCSVCGDTYTADEVEALGHDWGEWETTEDGQVRECSRCHVQQSCLHEHVTATAAVEATCTTDGNIAYWYCADCDKYYSDEECTVVIEEGSWVVPAAHKLTKTDAKDATCTVDGNVEYYTCSACGKYYSDEEATKELTEDELVIKAAGHSYDSGVITAPTCTEGGYTTYTCSVCGDEHVDDMVEAKGHSYESVVTAPTCTEGGYTTYTCSACGESYTADETEATGHDYQAVVTAPTCTEGGYTTYTCTACDYSYTGDETEALGHAIQLIEEVPATCEKEGTAAYYYCETCGTKFADEEATTTVTDEELVIAVTGHSLYAVAEVPATCSATGMAAHYACENCDEVFAEDSADSKTTVEALTLEIDADAHVVGEEVTWNWAEVSDYIVDAEGNYALNPEVYFIDETTGYPYMDEQGNPVTVGAYPDGSAITSVTLVLQQDSETGEYSISFMPTKIPDIYIEWVDNDGNGAMDDDEIAESIETYGYITRNAFTCDTVTFTCTACGNEVNAEAAVEQILVDQAYIEEMATNSAMGAMMQDEEAMNYFQATMQDLMADGTDQETAQQQAFYATMEAYPDVAAAMNQTVAELQPEYNSVLYTATYNDFTDTVNATAQYLSRTWANMCNFNEAYSQYFGSAAPYWTSKNSDESPMDAFKYVLNMQEEPFIPNSVMDYYMGMLTQAFMSYVYNYSDLLDAVLADAYNLVEQDEQFDDIDKLLLLHDWLAAYGEFDMQSLIDQQSGESAGSDPITMTAFGTLLHEALNIDGAVCLGYAATYNLLVQQVLGEDRVDFVQIKYLANVAESSVAAGDSGFGDGSAMFNSPHFLNAVKVDGDWFYVDACYDDINTEVISQERVETDGNISHSSFMVAPTTWEEMYEDNFQYMDSLYDGYDWVRVEDGEGGYMMEDADGNEYTESEADAAKEEDDTLQLFYIYEKVEDTGETRYDNDTYELAWFAGAVGTVNYYNGYFYYTAGTVNSYSSMKDLFDSDTEYDDSQFDSSEYDVNDLLQYKSDPSSQDKIVRRPVDGKNEPATDTDNSGMSIGAPADEYCEVLFHFGYGSIGAEAQSDYEKDNEDDSFSMDQEAGTADGREGAYYDLVVEDAEYLTNYPDVAHTTVMIDGNIYFNIGNAVYTFNASAGNIDMDNLELVKVKEYNTVTYSNLAVNTDTGANRFTGKTFVVDENGTESVTYHPVAALSVHNDISLTQDSDGNTVLSATPTLHISIATNFSNSYKDSDGNAYTIEARNYNPDYYRFMEDEESEEETNDNVEFMWTASIVDKMTVEDFNDDLVATSGTAVTVAAYCGHNAFTEERTEKCGLSIADTKVEKEGTALNHEYKADENEGTNICSRCLDAHDHDYSYATEEDVVFEWSEYTDEAGEVKLDATAYIDCEGNYCGEKQELTPVITEEDGVFTATVTLNSGTEDEIAVSQSMTVLQLNHPEHTYGDAEFTWTETEDGYTATAVKKCTYEGCDAVLEAEVEVVSAETKAATCEDTGVITYTATATFPDGSDPTTDTKEVVTEALDHAYGEDGKCTREGCTAVDPDYVAPTEPSEPDVTDPTDPSEPEETDPTDPSEPEETDPTDPSEPEETDPTEPSEPDVTEPSEPTDPTTDETT